MASGNGRKRQKGRLMIHKDVVGKKLLDLYLEIKNDALFSDYIMGGGTGLALQLGHRTSTDIDIFTTTNQDNRDILNRLNEKYNNYYIININKSVLEIVIKNIKIDFIRDNSNILEIPKTEDGITFFGIKDISAMKLRTILTRTKSRDFIDIAYLLQKFSLTKMFGYYKKKYNSDDIPLIKMALLKSKQIQKDEWLKDISMLKNDIMLENIPVLLEKGLEKYNKKHEIGLNSFFKNIKRLFK